MTAVQYRQEYSADWVLQWPETVEFAGPVADQLAPGYLLANQSRANAGFEITGNTIRETTANGIRLAARDGTVENNEIDGTGWRGIALRCDAGGWDSLARWTREVAIRNNRIRNSGLTGYMSEGPSAIDVRYNTGEDLTPVGRRHRNLTIQGNVLEQSAFLGVYLESAGRIDINGNRMAGLNEYPIRDGGGFGLGLDNVGSVSVRENRLSGPADRLYQFGWRLNADSVSLAENELTTDGAGADPRVVRWKPIVLDFDRLSGRRAAICTWPSTVPNSACSMRKEQPFAQLISEGGREMAVEFGEGVYDIEREDGNEGRWFGGEGQEAVLLFTAADLAAAATLQLTSRPFEEGISAGLRRDGTKRDTVTFGNQD